MLNNMAAERKRAYLCFSKWPGNENNKWVHIGILSFYNVVLNCVNVALFKAHPALNSGFYFLTYFLLGFGNFSAPRLAARCVFDERPQGGWET